MKREPKYAITFSEKISSETEHLTVDFKDLATTIKVLIDNGKKNVRVSRDYI